MAITQNSFRKQVFIHLNPDGARDPKCLSKEQINVCDAAYGVLQEHLRKLDKNQNKKLAKAAEEATELRVQLEKSQGETRLQEERVSFAKFLLSNGITPVARFLVTPLSQSIGQYGVHNTSERLQYEPVRNSGNMHEKSSRNMETDTSKIKNLTGPHYWVINILENLLTKFTPLGCAFTIFMVIMLSGIYINFKAGTAETRVENAKEDARTANKKLAEAGRLIQSLQPIKIEYDKLLVKSEGKDTTITTLINKESNLRQEYDEYKLKSQEQLDSQKSTYEARLDEARKGADAQIKNQLKEQNSLLLELEEDIAKLEQELKTKDIELNILQTKDIDSSKTQKKLQDLKEEFRVGYENQQAVAIKHEKQILQQNKILEYYESLAGLIRSTFGFSKLNLEKRRYCFKYQQDMLIKDYAEKLDNKDFLKEIHWRKMEKFNKDFSILDCPGYKRSVD